MFGLLGDLFNVAKQLGPVLADKVEAAANELNNTAAGIGIGEVIGGPIGAALGGLIGSQVGTGGDSPQAGGLSPGELVKRVNEGKGTQALQETHETGVAQSRQQLEIESRSRDLFNGLEAAWTGGASDAARARIQPLIDTSASASDTLTLNSRLSQAQIEQFHGMKNALHNDVTDNVPTKSVWDAGTPWDTDTEDKINEHNQKARENVERYTSYNQQSESNSASRTIDYGQLGNYQGGGFELENKPGGKPPKPSEKRFSQDGRDPGDPRTNPVDPPGYRPPQPVIPPPSHLVDPGQQHPGQQHPSQPGQHTPPYQNTPSYNDNTRAASYLPPTPPPGYQPGGFGPGSPGYSPPGGGGGGFGPGGGIGGFGGGFGPGSGSDSGSGSGSGSGKSLPGGGRSSGAGIPGESMGRPAGVGPAGAGGPGKPGASGMGGAGAGKGKGGGEDEEHQRASYLLESDPESIFGGTDERPTPPVIGL
ncbi:hypothetical protein [Amycolatopsis sp. H20-H5]|uniref:hypothetical protein n=1 Tax=Amycolatopsis sp. H20-H5 TaxID=3046309 RepID=UPI002DBCD072|nr:hypothetical protein [Amycolatopsis sp. H20-H5]MEC3974658.1 hypothetical protein [Amycolatopsis sp. H20-H5]